MKRPRIYTRTGDSGETSLYGDARIPKNHPRLEAYGKLDELSAALGLALAAIEDADLVTLLANVQNDLFDMGADLATPENSKFRARLPRLINEDDWRRLERWIDEYNAMAPPIEGFILPGGADAAARTHLARTICRSAERTLVKLGEVEEIRPDNLIYLNRLSDLLFVCARYINHQMGVEEILWEKRDREDTAETPPEG